MPRKRKGWGIGFESGLWLSLVACPVAVYAGLRALSDAPVWLAVAAMIAPVATFFAGSFLGIAVGVERADAVTRLPDGGVRLDYRPKSGRTGGGS